MDPAQATTNNVSMEDRHGISQQQKLKMPSTPDLNDIAELGSIGVSNPSNTYTSIKDEHLIILNQEHTVDIPSTSQSPPNLPCGDLINGNREDYFNICVPLYEASISGDWEAAYAILQTREELVRFAITEGYDTALHVAAKAYENKLTTRFVENLVVLMNEQDLALQNIFHYTAFNLASAAGNIKMVETMLKRNTNLLYIPGKNEKLPVYSSAFHGRYNTVKYLFDADKEMTRDCWTPQNRRWLLEKCVESDFFDVALQIVKIRPELTKEASILGVLARKTDALNIVKNLNLMWRVINSIFRYININVEVGPTEQDSDALKFLSIVWSHAIRTMPKNQVYDILRGPPRRTPDGLIYPSQALFVAAEMGNTRFVVEILRAYPDLIWEQNRDDRTLFHIAVMHRHQSIHNLLYEMGSIKDQIALFKDKYGNNMLHLVGLTSMKMRTRTSGASLLMQRELLWFKEIEKMVPPAFRERKNNDGQTPYELFSEKNEDLVAKGLNWMKYCMVVATLIVTVAFAVAFTVPGGYKQDHGLPVFIHDRTFLVFVIADAISLFSSSTSLLVFLSILTSRYGQRDFMYSLPRKLMIGLVTLFFSVAAMMVTFSASFFVLYHNRLKWVPILIATFSVMPVFVFAVLQFPLLVDMFRSMYDSRYLFKPTKRMLYSTNLRSLSLSL